MASQLIAGRYRLEEARGRGGMGEVHRATDTVFGRQVALKLIRADPDDEELTRRFFREGRITSRLDHPGIPAIYDQGRIEAPGDALDGRLYLAMQFVDGWTVDDLADTFDPLPLGWAASIAAQTCAVLHYAHQRQVIHRDLKPNNLMITSDGFVKVLDFGLATALGDPEQSKITNTGVPLGTWLYMAPEQFGDNKAVGPASDLYALGLILHRTLAGRPLFENRPFAEIAMGHLTEEPTPLRSLRPDVPEDLERLVLDLLTKDPQARPHNAQEVFRRLLPHVAELPELPGAITPGLTPARMYASVLTPLTIGVLPPPPFTRGDLDRLRRRATGLSRASRHTEAAQLLKDAAARAAQTLGSDHEEVLSTRRQLADLLQTAGRYTDASLEFAALAADFTRHGTKDDPQVLQLRQQEADCLVYAGQPHLGLAKLQDLLTDQTRVSGPDAPQTRELTERITLLKETMHR